MTQSDRLDGKVAVVTGGGARSERVMGIGETTCLRLAEEGANVVVVDVDETMAKRTVDRIEEEGGPEAVAAAVDLTDEDDLESLADLCEEEFGTVDVIVNNAGVRVEPGPVTEADAESWELTLNVNLRGVADCCKHLIPLMERDGGGSIVNVSSANALLGRKNWAQYDASKAGLLGLTRDMAADHADQDIRVNALLPGPTITDYHIQNGDIDDVEAHIEEQTTPHEDGPGILDRWAHPRELANGILFLASDESSFVTGATITVDGGLTAAGYDV